MHCPCGDILVETRRLMYLKRHTAIGTTPIIKATNPTMVSFESGMVSIRNKKQDVR
jgi:hypothetical protein